uniref:SMC-Scp complex subunit ScpB n=1 Tax=Desulfatirhabdium butyrativorans TaxID=340467 RepID=A0A7C4MKK4_9BACT
MNPPLKPILECILLVSDSAVEFDRLASLFPETDPAEIRKALEALKADYDERQAGVCLVQVAGGYQIRTRPEYAEWIQRFLKPRPQRLSAAAMETLAIVAYRQPIVRSEIEFIRGVDCGAVLRQLLERRLIRIAGRKPIAGRPLIYATGKRFLEVFGLNDIRDLPRLKEIESGAATNPDAEFERIRSMVTEPGVVGKCLT